MSAETYSFSLGEEIISVPSTVTYHELMRDLGPETIALILLCGSSLSWLTLIRESKSARNRTGNQSQEEYITQAIIAACRELSQQQQQRYSINKPEQL